MLLPLIFLFQMAITFKTLILLSWYNTSITTCLSDWLGRLCHTILLLYHITINILKFFQTVYLTLSLWACFLWHLLGPSSKGQDIFSILFNTHAPARSLQKVDLWSMHTSRRLTCHHYDHQLSLVIQVRGDNKHQAKPESKLCFSH
jgi:hypothetical protein